MISQSASTSLASLKNRKHIRLTTFRRTGTAVATPVWFVQVQRTLYVYTAVTAGKVKRIRNNPQVQLASCTMLGKVRGPSITGTARIVTDPQEQILAEAALNAKYWIARRLFSLLNVTIRAFQGRKPATPILYLAVNCD